MGYGDHLPSGGQHNKKPLTRGQIKKLQQAYATAGEISESVKNIEEKEQETTQREVQDVLNMIF
ncbi:hypothetical protein H7170_00725 [Candidatus Gracilibacteria bacterium]|nr:hypothetical protein [Candidatus Gracilibacteria bacterium]